MEVHLPAGRQVGPKVAAVLVELEDSAVLRVGDPDVRKAGAGEELDRLTERRLEAGAEFMGVGADVVLQNGAIGVEDEHVRTVERKRDGVLEVGRARWGEVGAGRRAERGDGRGVAPDL